MEKNIFGEVISDGKGGINKGLKKERGLRNLKVQGNGSCEGVSESCEDRHTAPKLAVPVSLALRDEMHKHIMGILKGDEPNTHETLERPAGSYGYVGRLGEPGYFTPKSFKGLLSVNRRRVERTYKIENNEQVVFYNGSEMPLSKARELAGREYGGNRINFDDCSCGISEVYAYPDVVLPEYKTASAVAFDISAAEDTIIEPIYEIGKAQLVHTGLKVFFGEDESFILVSRSGTHKLGLMLANGIGIFENDYYENISNDGEILAAFINFTKNPVKIEKGMRIAQGMFVDIKRANNLVRNNCERTGGFGSTGIS